MHIRNWFFGNILRPALRGVLSLFYKIQVSGLENIPKNKPCILVCNHESYLDALVLCLVVPRNIRFVTWYRLFSIHFVGFILRLHGDIPIENQNKSSILHAIDACKRELDSGGMIGIFPEGQLTNTGNIGDFRPGVSWIWASSPCGIVPVGISGFWNTIFSRKQFILLDSIKNFSFRRRVLKVNIGSIVTPAERPDPAQLQQVVLELSKN